MEVPDNVDVAVVAAAGVGEGELGDVETMSGLVLLEILSDYLVSSPLLGMVTTVDRAIVLTKSVILKIRLLRSLI